MKILSTSKKNSSSRPPPGTIRSALAMTAEASLVGDAAEMFSKSLLRENVLNDESKTIHEHSISAGTLHTLVLPEFPEKIRRVINAACAEKGGAERMTLKDWREAEQEVERILNL